MNSRLIILALVTAVLFTPVYASESRVLPLVDEPARAPYAIRRQLVQVTVGPSLSLIEGAFEFLYVRTYDSKDRQDPVLIDVPVVVRQGQVAPGEILKIAGIRLSIGANHYAPRDVLMLDHTILDPVPDLPDGARIALVSFNVPRRALKPKFKVQIAYEQPHLPGPDGEFLAIYVPFVPDFIQLRDALDFKPDDLVVTFNALPEVELRLDSVNAEVVFASPDAVTVRPRHRESITVVVESPAVAADAPLAPSR